MEHIPNYPPCFICGDKISKGLNQLFCFEDNYVITKFVAREEHMGHKAVHGGISAALLVEAMGLSVALIKNRLPVSAEMTIRYIKPLIMHEHYIVRARLEKDRRLLCFTYGEIIDKHQNRLVTATGKYVPLSKEITYQTDPAIMEFNVDNR